jgi:hypothetical protein
MVLIHSTSLFGNQGNRCGDVNPWKGLRVRGFGVSSAERLQAGAARSLQHFADDWTLHTPVAALGVSPPFHVPRVMLTSSKH